MKQPKKLKLDYKKSVSAYGLNPEHYMLQKEGDTYITIVNKQTGKIKIIDKYARPQKRWSETMNKKENIPADYQS